MKARDYWLVGLSSLINHTCKMECNSGFKISFNTFKCGLHDVMIIRLFDDSAQKISTTAPMSLHLFPVKDFDSSNISLKLFSDFAANVRMLFKFLY